MKLKEYLEKKQIPKPLHRAHCYACDRPQSVCLCHLVEPIDTRTRFVILMHPKEARKEKTGTGRLCNLVLKNSRLLIGVDFTDDKNVNSLIEDPRYKSVLLFPAAGAINLSDEGYGSLGGTPDKLQIFVVDGTWSLAGKLLRMSENLRALPTVSFTPRQPSKFRIKKQPRPECLSTLESIHLLLELGREQGVEKAEAKFDQLPEIFRRLVDIQLECAGAK